MSHTDLPEKLTAYMSRSNVALALSTGGGDVPLSYVNKAFCDLTGYQSDEVVGQNCRFLQGDDTDPAHKQALHDFVMDPEVDSGRFPILNYRKDGTTFLNFVLMTRLRDRKGNTRFILASQFDMTNTEKRAKMPVHDKKLSAELAEVNAMGVEFGLAMRGSAQTIADSIALLARMSLNE
ncbi:PAS domain-containing protein [Marivivens donghaensis]|uniref:PAS domain-containing protein n=1 Tax=Marivivens donghaensis TaxID=1699413 RepID=A0ABX0W0Z0_9RHOB|nr:PAS domain-containing protein [Marivivens donghaensis]NIY74002.1 PAS domain-containing protein [Marivivens donghaensis]